MKSKHDGTQKNLFEEAAGQNTLELKGAKRTDGLSKPLSFRAEPELQAILNAKAAEKNLSVSCLLRECVIAHLQHEGIKESAFEAYCELKHEIRELQKDILVATQALLISSGKFDEEEVQQWARANLKAGLRRKH